MLNAATYLESIGDTMRVHESVLLTPVPWLCNFLIPEHVKPIAWSTNASNIFFGLHAGLAAFDVVHCLPGASLAMITLEEIVAAGAKRVAFLGSAASVSGRLAPGTVLTDGDVISVLNPFQEQEEWSSIAGHAVVDMETTYLRVLAAHRGIPFSDALVMTDQVWEDDWKRFIRDAAFEVRFQESRARILFWLEHFFLGR